MVSFFIIRPFVVYKDDLKIFFLSSVAFKNIYPQLSEAQPLFSPHKLKQQLLSSKSSR
jgi:hypothetical protein